MKVNTGRSTQGDYSHYIVREAAPLLEWLLANVAQSRSKVKATLQGRGVKVDGKNVPFQQTAEGLFVDASYTVNEPAVCFKIAW